MKASKFSDAQKAFILKQGADGVPVADICRNAGISQATYFNWKKKYDGMLPPDMRRMKQLKDENTKLRKLVATRSIDFSKGANRLAAQDHPRLATSAPSPLQDPGRRREQGPPCCSGEFHRFGEDVSERLDIIPTQIRVLVTRQPKYACRACEEGVVQTPALSRSIESGLPREAAIAHVICPR
jgi:putative transposase